MSFYLKFLLRSKTQKEKQQQMKNATIIFTTFAGLLCAANSTTTASKPRVFITDSQSWEAVATRNVALGGARPQTAEIYKTFGERCQGVIVTNARERADYVVTLDHEGGKGLIRRDNKFAVFSKEGDMLKSGSTRSLGNSVQDACTAIVNNK